MAVMKKTVVARTWCDPRGQSAGAESPAAPVRGMGEVHLYNLAEFDTKDRNN